MSKVTKFHQNIIINNLSVKTSERKKKHKLNVSFDYNFRLIGIASHEKDYKLVWSINQVLDLNFVRQEDHIVFNKKLDTDQSFSHFIAEENNIIYNLLSNRSEDGFLADEINNFDYLLQIIGDITDAERNEIIKKIKSVDKVLTAIKLDPNCLASKHKLIT